MAENFSGKIEKYDLPIDFTKCAGVCIEKRWLREDAGEYLGGIDEDGHERKDNYVPSYDTHTVMFKYNKKADALIRSSDFDDETEVSISSALDEIERHLDSQRTDENYSAAIYYKNAKTVSLNAAELYEKAQSASKNNTFDSRVAAAQSILVPDISNPDCNLSL